jgi:PPOX class probable F420-dependent enzyme
MAGKRISSAVKKALKRARVARMATVDVAGWPYVVPICFVYDGGALYTAIDRKPKRVKAERLARIRNIAATGKVALVVDEYRQDWSRLWYVALRGRARQANGAEREHAIGMLRRKYRQYSEGMLADDAVVIKIVAQSVKAWGKV